jgi:hypothetical protein
LYFYGVQLFPYFITSFKPRNKDKNLAELKQSLKAQTDITNKMFFFFLTFTVLNTIEKGCHQEIFKFYSDLFASKNSHISRNGKLYFSSSITYSVKKIKLRR